MCVPLFISKGKNQRFFKNFSLLEFSVRFFLEKTLILAFELEASVNCTFSNFCLLCTPVAASFPTLPFLAWYYIHLLHCVYSKSDIGGIAWADFALPRAEISALGEPI